MDVDDIPDPEDNDPIARFEALLDARLGAAPKKKPK